MSGRQEADEFRAQVTEPLRTARDHCHWHAVHRGRKTAGFIEGLLEAVLRISYAFEGILARGEE